MWYVCDMLYAVLFVNVNWSVVRGCDVSRRYIHVCNSDVFSVVNMYLDHSKLCVLMVDGKSVVMNVTLYLMIVMSPPPTYRCWSYVLCVFYFRGELGFLDCNDICMCVVNKHFELLEIVFNSVYVYMKYNEISLTFTVGSVCWWVVCVAMWSSLICLRGCLGTLCGCSECDACTVVCVACEYCERMWGARVTAMLVWGTGEV